MTSTAKVKNKTTFKNSIDKHSHDKNNKTTFKNSIDKHSHDRNNKTTFKNSIDKHSHDKNNKTTFYADALRFSNQSMMRNSVTVVYTPLY